MNLHLSPDTLALNPGLDGKEIRVKARDLPPGEPSFKSKLEKRAWEQWIPTQQAARVFYEPLTLRLTGGNYTPDFLLVMPDHSLRIVEVKGSWKAYQSGRTSRRNLRQAAIEFAWLGRFYSLLPDKRGWNLKEVT